MRVFVTGASGHIGAALVPELLSAGHRVIGLARSDAAAEALQRAGAEARRGDLDDLAGLTEAARACDGVIHLAFKHDIAFSGDYAGAVQADFSAITALADGLAGSDKPFLGTAGTIALAFAELGRAAREADVLTQGPRIDAENTVIALAQRGVRAAVVRLAPSVHSDLDHTGFVPSLIALARKNGFAAYVGDGQQRWPACNTRDAARLYRLALERVPAGTRLHGVAEQGVPFRSIAEAIGRGLGLPVKSVSPDEAPAALGFLASFAQRDNPTDSTFTQELLGWHPREPGLLADLAAGFYFAAEPA